MTILSGGSARRACPRPRRGGGRGSPARRGRRRRVRWPAPRRRLGAAPTACRPRWWRAGENRWPPRCSAARSGRAAATSTMVSPSASSPRSKISAASSALSTVDSAGFADSGSTARSTRPLCDSSHCPSVNGADADGSIGMPTLADRTAATTHPLRSAGATEANDASPHSGAALRHRRATPPAVEEADAPTVGVHQAVLLASRRIRLHQQPVRRVEHQRRHRTGSPSQPGGGTSADVPGQPDTGEDLPADRVVPVAEAGPQDARRDRPRSAAQHLVVASRPRRTAASTARRPSA